MAGLYFEQFSVGQTFVHEIRRTVTDMDNILFSSLTYNPAAVHIDHEYAKSTEFGKPLMNSIFTLGLVIGLSVQDTTLGTTVGNLGGDCLSVVACRRLRHGFLHSGRRRHTERAHHVEARAARPQRAV